jgi:thiol-disulfide isomerase/thioredoxin
MPLAVARQVDTGIVAAVRSALRGNDLSGAKRLVQSFRDENGTTPEALEALSWVARGLLTGHRVREASEYAREAHRLAVRYLKRASLDSEPHLAAALGASIEVLAQGMAQSRRRAEAVRFLKREIAKFRGTPIHTRIRKNLNLLAMEGQPAPELESREWLGAKPPSLSSLRGRPVVLFFWAHYCDDSRAEARVLARIGKRFGPVGLTLISATRRYGYFDEQRRQPAGPRQEKQHIKQILDTYYSELKDMPVIISEQTLVSYGVSTTPTLVLVDCGGVVSLYHPGKMDYGELARHVKRALSR